MAAKFSEETSRNFCGILTLIVVLVESFRVLRMIYTLKWKVSLESGYGCFRNPWELITKAKKHNNSIPQPRR